MAWIAHRSQQEGSLNLPVDRGPGRACSRRQSTAIPGQSLPTRPSLVPPWPTLILGQACGCSWGSDRVSWQRQEAGRVGASLSPVCVWAPSYTQTPGQPRVAGAAPSRERVAGGVIGGRPRRWGFLPHLESLPVIISTQLVVSGAQNGERGM